MAFQLHNALEIYRHCPAVIRRQGNVYNRLRCAASLLVAHRKAAVVAERIADHVG